MPRPRRIRLAPPTRAVALIALLCTLPAVGPRQATLAFGRVPQSPPSIGRLEPTEASVRRLPAALRAQLRDNLYDYFRFVNAQWMQAMCDRFTDARTGLPNVGLHGDPHIEQYAFTADSRGLDDFDDSTLGPFVLDVTRFLASVDLALDQRGWNGSRDKATGAFLAGYRASLSDTTYLPSDPSAVTRLRAKEARDAHEFLAWVDSLMLPLDPEYEAAVPFVGAVLEEHASRVNRGMPPAFFRVKKTGRLNLGVGSALASKVLLRLEGSSSADDDDVIVEAKRSGDLSAVPCLDVVARGAVRVVTGSERIGRLRHQFMMVLPPFRASGSDEPRWWLRSWDPSYREVDLADYVSADEIVEVAHDVGAQLGRGHMAAPDAGGARDVLQQVRRLDGLEPRIRSAVADQTAELVKAWRRFRERE